MQRTLNNDTAESRTWSVDEMTDGLQDLISPLQTYGGICFKYIDTIDAALKQPSSSDNDHEQLKADKAFYSQALSSVQNGLNILRDLVDWMQSLPLDDSGSPKLEE